MTASKYWGEEKYPDAIYSVYLKKVRYVSPPVNNVNSDSTSAGIDADDHLQWETIRERVIKTGTTERLVESLIDSEGQLDSRHFNIFFATYRTFAHADEILQIIIDWHRNISSDNQPTHSKIHSDRIKSTLSTIKSITICWLEMYPEDFYVFTQVDESQEMKNNIEFTLIEKLIAFSKENNLHDLKQKARKLRDKFKQVYQSGGLSAQLPSIAGISFALTGYDPIPSITSPNTSSQFEVESDERYAMMLAEAQTRAQMFDIACDNVPQIAEQLTFWDALLFRDLKPYQCQGSIWGKRNRHRRPDLVYSVRATIDQFNAICQRVMTSVVLPEFPPQLRARIIEKWIHIAKELRILNNYSSLKAIISSLQSEPVYRLKIAWSHVTKTPMVMFNELSALLDQNMESSNQNGRKSLHPDETIKISPKKSPMGNNCRRTKSDINIALETQGNVPYLGTIITELQMVDQAYPDKTEEELINFEKRRQEFEILAKLRLYQSAARAYSIPMDQAFCVWFNFLPALDEKDCFIRSLEIEPNGNEQTTPNIRRKMGEGMTKINSLSKIFSGLGNSGAKEGNNQQLGNSLFFAAGEYGFPGTTDKDKRSSFGAGSIDRSPFESKAQSNNLSAEKPPRGQRSRSQGAKKENRCKQNAQQKGLTRQIEDNNGEILAAGNSFTGSEFTPTKPSNLRLTQIRNGGNAPVDFISNFGQRIGRPTNLECLDQNDSIDSPSADHFPPFHSSSASSSFGRPQMLIDEFKGNGSGRGSDFGAANNFPLHGQGGIGAQKEILDRIKHFQKSTSSSSSRSSLGNGQKYFGGASPSSISVSNCPREEQNFHLIRVGLDDLVEKERETVTTNYKCIKVINGDRMPQLIQRALEKHLIDPNESPNYCLVQLLPDGGELRFPDHCNPFYAVAPDPSSPMLNCILKKRIDCQNASNPIADHNSSMEQTKKMNKQKRNNLLRWSSGFL